MTRRALTLLELLIAIALMIALAAIALPTVLGDVDEREHETALEVLTSQLLLARAHAQATGRAVEVTFVASPPRIEARFFPLTASDEGRSPSPAVTRDRSRPPFGRTRGLEDEEDTAIFEGWAVHDLPASSRIEAEPPATLLGDAADRSSAAWLLPPADLEPTTPGRGDALAADERLRLAVYLPDGSTLLGEPRWIGGVDGRVSKLTINPWTGLPKVEPVAVDDPEFRPEEGEDENEDEGAEPAPDAIAPADGPREEPERRGAPAAETEIPGDDGAPDRAADDEQTPPGDDPGATDEERSRGRSRERGGR